jgi:hypothetical protein
MQLKSDILNEAVMSVSVAIIPDEVIDLLDDEPSDPPLSADTNMLDILFNSLTPICLLAGTKNYPSVGFLLRNSMFFIISAAQPQPTNNTTMVSFRPLPRCGFNTYTRSSANAR